MIRGAWADTIEAVASQHEHPKRAAAAEARHQGCWSRRPSSSAMRRSRSASVFPHLGQLLEHGRRLEPVAVVDGGIARDKRPVGAANWECRSGAVAFVPARSGCDRRRRPARRARRRHRSTCSRRSPPGGDQHRRCARRARRARPARGCRPWFRLDAGLARPPAGRPPSRPRSSTSSSITTVPTCGTFSSGRRPPSARTRSRPLPITTPFCTHDPVAQRHALAERHVRVQQRSRRPPRAPVADVTRSRCTTVRASDPRRPPRRRTYGAHRCASGCDRRALGADHRRRVDARRRAAARVPATPGRARTST